MLSIHVLDLFGGEVIETLATGYINTCDDLISDLRQKSLCTIVTSHQPSPPRVTAYRRYIVYSGLARTISPWEIKVWLGWVEGGR